MSKLKAVLEEKEREIASQVKQLQVKFQKKCLML